MIGTLTKRGITKLLLLSLFLILFSLTTHATWIDDAASNFTGNVTFFGAINNFSTVDSSLKMYTQSHTNFGSNYGESIELHALTGSAKPFIGWYAYDDLKGNDYPVGWIGCHYNLTNGNIHKHCSWETLDNETGTPTINTKFEISYGSNNTAANGGSKAQFSSLSQVIYSGVDILLSGAASDILGTAPIDLYPGNQVTIGLRTSNNSQNLTVSAVGTDNFTIEDNLYTTGTFGSGNGIIGGLDLNSGVITEVTDIRSTGGNSIDLESSNVVRFFPFGQTNVGLQVSNDTSSNVTIQGLSSSQINILDNLGVTGNISLTDTGHIPSLVVTNKANLSNLVITNGVANFSSAQDFTFDTQSANNNYNFATNINMLNNTIKQAHIEIFNGNQTCIIAPNNNTGLYWINQQDSGRINYCNPGLEPTTGVARVALMTDLFSYGTRAEGNTPSLLDGGAFGLELAQINITSHASLALVSNGTAAINLFALSSQDTSLFDFQGLGAGSTAVILDSSNRTVIGNTYSNDIRFNIGDGAGTLNKTVDQYILGRTQLNIVGGVGLNITSLSGASTAIACLRADGTFYRGNQTGCP